MSELDKIYNKKTRRLFRESRENIAQAEHLLKNGKDPMATLWKAAQILGRLQIRLRTDFPPE